MAGQDTPLVSVEDYEEHALRVLPRSAADFYRCGAGEEFTLRSNSRAFNRLRIRPRVMVDVSRRDCSVTVLGTKVLFPAGISPTSMQRIAHPDGECATAQAAGAMGTIFILSTLSTSSIEEVAAAAPNTIKWFQLYIYKDRSVTQSLVERAERSGYKALVLTVDSAVFGMRRPDLKNAFSLPSHLRITKLPIILKGILTAEDAVIGADLGAAAILVSNHGGRQLDGVPATIEALPEIVRAVEGRVEVYLDGGVRGGTDVFKALALGARMVFMGRPPLWGLVHSGQEGVKKVLDIVKWEFVCVDEYEEYALQHLDKNALDYYKSGAGDEITLGQNKTAFKRLLIRPRCLRDVSQCDASTTVLGHKVAMPVGVSPTAMQRMAHPDGECANAKAAGAVGTIFILSTLSTSSIEEVAAAAPNTIKWFQLYIYKDRDVTRQLVERAERANFKALVLTVDASLFGIRRSDVRNKFTLPPHLTLANFTNEKATDVNKSKKGSGINEYVASLFDSKITWEDVKWLKRITKLPIVLKGILTAEDAVIGADLGVAAILVSNHGARQVDTTPASIEALPEIVRAVEGRVEVYLDGGVRGGTDVFKALALGARMVFMGRPPLWGLVHSGQEGVKNVLDIVKWEFDTTLALTGSYSRDNERIKCRIKHFGTLHSRLNMISTVVEYLLSVSWDLITTFYLRLKRFSFSAAILMTDIQQTVDITVGIKLNYYVSTEEIFFDYKTSKAMADFFFKLNITNISIACKINVKTHYIHTRHAIKLAIRGVQHLHRHPAENRVFAMVGKYSLPGF
uniref:(S)-2-hydroxy-acid oxidase n=1 Tax=Timema bartmani TaxID=61472 RepID=A0A7R9FAK9_9NEOP|nr:unnamed protein product [Timema bartmani]